MNHLNQEDILRLGKKILWEYPFDDKDVDDMYHISECDQCYEDLCCMIKLMDLTDHMDRYFTKKSNLPAIHQENGAIVSAVICISISQIASTLKQRTTNNTLWFFDPALPRLNLRSGKTPSDDTVKLEDNDNSQSYITFDKSKRMLHIRLDCRQDTDTPKVYLKKADGTIKQIELKKNGLLFYADIQNMFDGEYELILEAERENGKKTMEERAIEDALRCADPPPGTKFDF